LKKRLTELVHEHTNRQFHLTRFGAIALDTSPPYLIQNLIPREGLVIVWGPPKCGKTFWTFDLAMHIALGRVYRGRKTEVAGVVYIACEGQRGLAARAAAFRQTQMLDGDDPPFYLLTTRLDLPAQIDPLISDIAAQLLPDGAPCGAIVLDTLNRSIGGSESKDEDMTAYVVAADALRERFKCAVIVIHHCGVDGSRPRGHTSLAGAADAQIAVKRDAAHRIIAEVEWLKDGPEGDQIISRLESIVVGEDDNGTPITSCIVVDDAGSAPVAKTTKRRKLPDAARIALGTLRKAIAEAGSAAPASDRIPSSVSVVEVDAWRRYHYAGTAADGQTPDARKKEFQRVREQLQAAGVIGIHTDFCWISIDPDRRTAGPGQTPGQRDTL
jgi:AAA domain